MPQIKIRWWRIINTIVFGTGLIAPWIRLNLDAQSIPYQPTPGWKLILGTWLGVWDDFMVNGLDFRMWPFWLLGFSDVLLIVYLIRNLYLIIKDVNHNSNKLLSLMLLGVASILLFEVLLGDQPLLGYWLINLGLLSSAVLEWTMPARTYKKNDASRF